MVFLLSPANQTPQSIELNMVLYRALVNNMILGVSEGYKMQLEVVGVGYRASANGQTLELSLGYSHPFVMEIAKEVKVSAESAKGKAPVVTLESHG